MITPKSDTFRPGAASGSIIQVHNKQSFYMYIRTNCICQSVIIMYILGVWGNVYLIVWRSLKVGMLPLHVMLYIYIHINH